MVVIKLCVVSTLFCTAWLMVIIALFDKVKITSGNVYNFVYSVQGNNS